MKARHFKKLRSQVKEYNVQESERLFGEFWMYRNGTIILARSHSEAVVRLRKRQRLFRDPRSIAQTDSCWAKYMCFETSKPSRLTYWR
jgi:hypothetical protein